MNKAAVFVIEFLKGIFAKLGCICKFLWSHKNEHLNNETSYLPPEWTATAEWKAIEVHPLTGKSSSKKSKIIRKQKNPWKYCSWKRLYEFKIKKVKLLENKGESK